MAINNLDDWIAAAKQRVTWQRTWTSRTTVAGFPFSLIDLAGKPGPGTLAGTNTTNGVVPTDATAGFPLINSFGGAKGYLSSVDFWSTVIQRFMLHDLVFQAGAYSFNASQTLSSQPSYSGRMPGGTDYSNTEIWFECVTAFTGNPTLTVTYTNESGVTGRTTGAVAFTYAPTLGRLQQLPLQAGDTGVQKIESVTMTVATAGTFNINVMRRLWANRVQIAQFGDTDDMLKTGLVEVFDTSAFYLSAQPDSTSTGIFDISLVLAVK